MSEPTAPTGAIPPLNRTESGPRKCLHCDQTRAQIKANGTICGTESGYEYVELDDEWPQHRWRDWTDADLAGFGITPEAFERHRRTQITQMEWVSCVDTTRGHQYPEQDAPEWGERVDQCYACGHVETPASPSTEPKVETDDAAAA